MRRSLIVVDALFLLGARTRAVRSPSPPLPAPLSITRSFEVTDKPIAGAFTLDRVLGQLIARSGVNMTPDQLIRQMFDTQNPKPGVVDAASPHCDDFLTNGAPSFNGFPRRCPTPEGKLASVPDLAQQFFTIGVINRFDQTPPDGANCGQYRMVFAHRDDATAASTLVRRHLIFEAVLPNPHPEMGIAACRPVAQFWADLSAIDSMEERRARLDHFFFEGLDGFAPVIDSPNFATSGGIRTLQQAFDNGVLNIRFYQFRLAKECATSCTLRFVPDVLENTPYGLLFAAADTSEKARAAREELLRQVPDLTIEDLNLMKMRMPREYLMVESHPHENAAEDFFANAVTQAATTAEGAAYRGQIETAIAAAGSSISSTELLNRAEEMTCVGCHGFNGAVDFGGAVKLVIGFQGDQMISEDILADGEAGPNTRYGIDPIIEKQFAPHRLKILQDFLRDGTPPVHSE
jgi:hypothetical protein